MVSLGLTGKAMALWTGIHALDPMTRAHGPSVAPQYPEIPPHSPHPTSHAIPNHPSGVARNPNAVLSGTSAVVVATRVDSGANYYRADPSVLAGGGATT